MEDLRVGCTCILCCPAEQHPMTNSQRRERLLRIFSPTYYVSTYTHKLELVCKLSVVTGHFSWETIKEKALRKSQSLTSCILHLMDFLTLLKLIRPPSLLSLDSLERSRCVLLPLFICVHKSTMLGLAECQVQLICLLKSIVTLQCKM